jgi:O-antigen/teichoic acid export membrane protein
MTFDAGNTSFTPVPLGTWQARLAQSLRLLLLTGIDQGLSAGANFVITILAARWLDAEQYGACAVGFSVYLFVLSLYTETIAEPMTVLACSQYVHTQARYYGAVSRLHAAVTAALTMLVAVSVPLMYEHNKDTALALLGVALSLPFLLSYFVLRRVCYARSDSNAAATGAVIYAACSLGALFAIGPERMSPLLLFAVNAAGGGGATLVMGLQLWRRLRAAAPETEEQLSMKHVLGSHMKHARWALPGSLGQALGALLVAPALALAAGLSAAAQLRAAQNLALPIIQLQSALSLLVLPRLARRFAQGGAPALRRSAIQAGALLLALCAPYAVLVALAGDRVLTLVYGTEAYDTVAPLLLLLLPAALLGAVSGTSVSGLRAAHRAPGLFWTKLSSAGVTCVFGLPLIVRFGTTGAAWAMIAIAATEATVGGLLLLHATCGVEGQGRARPSRP